jgi:uncharacterized membrane protein YeiH
MLCAVSALEIYAVCCISVGGAIYYVLYQHSRCDILCAVSALDVRLTMRSVSILLSVNTGGDIFLLYVQWKCGVLSAVYWW